MNVRTRFFVDLSILVALASFVLASVAAGGGRSIVRNNVPRRMKFGTRRAAADEGRATRRPSFVLVVDAEQRQTSSSSSPSPSEVGDAFVRDESPSAAIEPLMETYNPRRIVADGARAAAVAFVSAAAIGGARHAVEMIIA